MFALLGIQAIVLLSAWHDLVGRKSRLKWDHTLEVAVVVIRAGSVEDTAVSALESHLLELEDRLEAEFGRYQPNAVEPFHFTLYGPIDGPMSPLPPTEPELVAAAHYAWTAWRYRARIDSELDLPARGCDARLYVAVR